MAANNRGSGFAVAGFQSRRIGFWSCADPIWTTQRRPARTYGVAEAIGLRCFRWAVGVQVSVRVPAAQQWAENVPPGCSRAYAACHAQFLAAIQQYRRSSSD